MGLIPILIDALSIILCDTSFVICRCLGIIQFNYFEASHYFDRFILLFRCLADVILSLELLIFMNQIRITKFITWLTLVFQPHASSSSSGKSTLLQQWYEVL
jgi:hypothetical protein